MAKRIFQFSTFTPTATTDGTTFANGSAMTLDAGTGTAYLEVLEIYMGGQAAASTINIMQFARNTAIATTGTLSAGATDGPARNYTAPLATPNVAATTASTLGARTTANTAARLNLSINSFGGIVRWVAAPGEEWGILGTSANQSSSSLSALTGATAGAIGAHIIYEPY